MLYKKDWGRRILFLCFAVILFLPLLDIPPWLSPPDWGKAIVFRIAVSLLWMYVAWTVCTGKKRIGTISLKSIPGLLIIVLVLQVLVYLLAAVFSPDPLMSFLGDPIRSGGLVNYAFLASFVFLLLFFLESDDWQTVMKWAIWGAVGVSAVAIVQWQGLLPELFVATGTRPTSTLGSTMTLGLFLILFVFLSLTNKKWGLPLAALFTFVIALTETRAVFLGLGIGLFFFLFWYPTKEKARALFMKYVLIGTLLLGGVLLLAANLSLSSPDLLKRLKVPNFQNEPRFAAWQVTLQAINASPVLGYGPENFAIGFDKFYNPALPNLSRVPGSGVTTWWDRGHNILLDTAMQGGIGAVLLLLLLWMLLFWGLQKVKKEKGELALKAHGLQAAFLGYGVANLFSFETFSTQLIFFTLLAYSLHLISLRRDLPPKRSSGEAGPSKLRVPIFILVGFAFLWFNWNYTLKPLAANANIIEAKALAKSGNCQEALPLAENAVRGAPGPMKSYAALSLGDIILDCQSQLPDKRPELAQKAIEALQTADESRPLFPRAWIAMGGFTNILLETASREGNQEKVKGEAANADMFFRKALELSPKRQETYIEWVKTFLIQGDYEGAKEKIGECLSLNINSAHCWFLLARAEISLGNAEQGSHALKTAELLGYNPTSRRSLLQLANAYLASQNYQAMAKIYETLTSSNYDPVPRAYYETLIALYQQLGQRENILHAAGRMYLVFGDYEKSKVTAKECIAFNAQSAYCWYLLGKAESALGNEEEGERAKARAQELFEIKQ
ncbi:MAG: O-antigen ligase family protein [Parcubacteria group bacterium]|nr:O-antigen ligase family protein [Parcubacteria group bacterium]